MSNLLILTPVFNDWESFENLIEALDVELAKQKLFAEIYAVDDGSSQPMPDGFASKKTFHQIKEVSIVHLARNLGHQRAIATGLAYLAEKNEGKPVIVMDSDGEDRPEDIAVLWQSYQHNPNAVIFAKRSQRSEGWLFISLYSVYKFLFMALTGQQISFGNFSLLPPNLLRRVVYLSEIWNHYAAGVIKAKFPIVEIPTFRGERYAGKSKLGFVGLVIHGLSAISVFVEFLTVRLILASLFMVSLGSLTFLGVLYIFYFTALAIPGWATNFSFSIAILVLQILTFAILLGFVVLNARSNKQFIPAKDYQDYIMNVRSLLNND